MDVNTAGIARATVERKNRGGGFAFLGLGLRP
jgi:hypothetical protein